MPEIRSSEDCIYIDGFKLAGYRSFGIDEEQTLGPFKQMNLFVGQNNCGKSNVLKLIKEHLRWLVNELPLKEGRFPDSVRFGRSRANSLVFRVGWSRRHLSSLIPKALEGKPLDRSLLERVLFYGPLSEGGLTYLPVQGLIEDLVQYSANACSKFGLIANEDWRSLTKAWLQASQIINATSANSVRDLLAAFSDQATRIPIPMVHYITHERMISRQELACEAFPDDVWDGKATISQLAMLQNPGSETTTSEELSSMRGKFERLNKFLQDVLENQTARIQANFHRTTLLVDLDGRVDTLDSFGAGIHQLIMIAIATTYHDGQIFCIEEPETNMHPSLQRKLLRYLVDETTNQYFITTHSASLIDAVDDAAVFHLVHDGKQTIVTGMLSKKDQRQICEDLGFRASDLVQTNCMIWVEGPSDRIYINKLISILDDSLSEGKHYSFGFYGGACRSHLALLDDGEDTENDKAWNDFVDLLAINKNAVMIADSDLINSSEAQTNASKLRLEQEFKRYAPNSWYWQTEGREIENYVKESVFIDARGLKEKYMSDKELPEAEFLNRKVTRRQTSKGVDTSIDKVTVARKVCESDQPFEETTNARGQGQILVDKIRSWNGLECKQ